jgi:hypothetical protein
VIPLYAIGYRLTLTGAETFRLTATYVRSEERDGWVRSPQTWYFNYPPVDGMPGRFGTSETLGLLGGVKNAKQFRYSEAVERALGDVLTTMICEILDGNDIDPEGGATILTLGLAFPKVVGRVLSLRPPERVRFGWLCPRPFPEWIAEGVNESVILGLHTWGLNTDWEDERLLVTSETQDSRGSILTFQKLCPCGVVNDLNIPPCAHIIKDLCNALLPKEVALVTEQIDAELQGLYQHEPEESLQRPKNPVETLSYQSALGQQQTWPSGWAIKWESQ